MHPALKTSAGPNAHEIRQLLDAELSLRSRVFHVALLLGALMMSVVIASLWATEPELPAQTRVAFAIGTLIGLSWVWYAAWVLTRRRPLFARQRVIAGHMAVVFTTVFLAASLTIGLDSGKPAAFAVAAVGVGMLAAAMLVLHRARRAFAMLSEHRAVLERTLHGDVS